MGNHLATTAPQLDFYLNDLPNISYDQSLGKSRFLKTIKCFNDEGAVIVKVYIKTPSDSNLQEKQEELEQLRDSFAIYKNPNAFPFSTFSQTEKAGYMIRQYFHNNLYDRLSTRPFLTDIEKLWLTFQLIRAIEKCHFYGIFHCDLKTENVMVTSWNWLYVTDFAPYKPLFIPEDNPADFDYFFDSSGRRKCYIAPERFYTMEKPSEDDNEKAKMDMFSLGCTIAELWLEGEPLFTYSELLQYKKGQYDPNHKISQIHNVNIQNVVRQLINKNPDERPGASVYLKEWRGEVFPIYFDFLHEYINGLMSLEPDVIIERLCGDFDTLLERIHERKKESEPERTTLDQNFLSENGKKFDLPNLDDFTKSSEELRKKLAEKEQMEKQVDVMVMNAVKSLQLPKSLVGESDKLFYSLAMSEKAREESGNEPRADQSLPVTESNSIHNPETEEEKRTLDEARQVKESLAELGQKINSRLDQYSLGLVGNGNELANELVPLPKQIQPALQQFSNSSHVYLEPHPKALKWLNSWSVDDVCLWLQKVGFPEFIPNFRENKISGSFLIGITELSHLNNCGIPRTSAKRIALLNSIKELKMPTTNSFATSVFDKPKLVVPQPTSIQTLSASISSASSSSMSPSSPGFSNLQKPSPPDGKTTTAQVPTTTGTPTVATPIITTPTGTSPSNTLAITTTTKNNVISDTSFPTSPSFTPTSSSASERKGFAIILELVSSMVRNVEFISSKLRVLECFSLISNYVDDECRLQRIVPYLVALLKEDTSAGGTIGNVGGNISNSPSGISGNSEFTGTNAAVTAGAIRTLTEIIGNVRIFSASDAHLFSDYLLPVLIRFGQEHPSQFVSQTFAQCLPSLAYSARLFLETSQFFKGKQQLKQTGNAKPPNFKHEIDTLRNSFKESVEHLLRTDSPRSVKMALLSDIATLCEFFGQEKTNELLLPLIISCLNDRDGEIKCVFFQNIVGVSTIAGANSVELFILPCVLEQIYDEDEYVLDSAINCLTSLCNLDIFRKQKLLHIAQQTAPLLLHPNAWVRYAAIALMVCISTKLSLVDVHCYLLPMIQPYFVRRVVTLTESTFLVSLLEPISRRSFDKALLSLYNEENAIDNDEAMFSVSVTSSPTTNTTTTATTSPISVTGQTPVERGSANNTPLTPLTPSPGNIPLNDSFIFINSSKNSSIGDGSGSGGGFDITSATISGKREKESDFVAEAHVLPIFYSQEKHAADEGKSQIQDIVFALKIAELDVPQEDEAKLFIARDFIKGASKSRNRKGDKHVTKELSFSKDELAAIPVQSIPYVAHDPDPVPIAPSDLAQQSQDLPPDQQSTSPTLAAPYTSTTLRATFTPSNPEDDEWVALFGQKPAREYVTGGGGGSVTHALPRKPEDHNDDANILDEFPDEGKRKKVGVGSVGGVHQNVSLRNPVEKLLPQKAPELGTLVRRSGASIPTPVMGSTLRDWQPRGELVAHLHEHTGRITGIEVSSDNLFFATSSADGTVRIWDCQRLEKNVTTKSRLTYHVNASPPTPTGIFSGGGWRGTNQSANVRVTSLAVCENSHSIACGASDGSVHVFRIDYVQKKENLFEYTNTSVIKKLKQNNGSIVSVKHFTQEFQSLIIFATETGIVRAWDLRANKEAWSMTNRSEAGYISAMTIDPSRFWLVVGTHQGELCGWDLRFRLPFPRQWATPDKSTVHCLTTLRGSRGIPAAGNNVSGSGASNNTPNGGSGNNGNLGAGVGGSENESLLCASGPGLMQIWDMETGRRTWNFRQAQSQMAPPVLLPTESGGTVKDKKSSKMSRTTTMNKTMSSSTTTTSTTSITTTTVISSSSSSSSKRDSEVPNDIPDYGIKGLASSKSTTITRAVISPCGGNYIITAGTDRKIRYWDMERPHNSYIISGLECNEDQPKYRCTSLEDITIFDEEPTIKSINMADIELLPDPALVSPSIHHHDTITQLGVLEVPHQMLISGSRDGVVKVWH